MAYQKSFVLAGKLRERTLVSRSGYAFERTRQVFFYPE